MDTSSSSFPDGPEMPPPDEEGGGPSLADVVDGAEALGAAGEFLGSAAVDAAAGAAEAGGSALEAAGSCLGGCSGMILVAALTGWAAYASADGPAKPPAAAPAPSYDKVIDPILKKYCAGCHGPRMGRAGYNVTVHEYLFKNKMGKVMLVAGRPEKSPLLTTMERTDAKRMPPKRELLQPTKEEIELIRAWIKAGAKDD